MSDKINRSEYDELIESKFGKDRLACVYVNNDGEIGIMYAQDALFSYDPHMAKEVLDLLCKTLRKVSITK